MDTKKEHVNLLARREIEARMAVPLIEAFAREIGKELAIEIASQVIQSLAKQSGQQLAEQVGGNSLADLSKGIALWQQGDAMSIELLEQSETTLAFHVVKCRYAEMYRESGLQDYGMLLSCNRDFAMIQGFNPDITLFRTQTIMEGKPCCDFRYTLQRS
ncbi:succinate dehydrogenase/fumarate reductase Fe-S protein subunit-like protein [Candidatus Vecturithrix granuli]|uniref:Succinate dehydrogenase/fumarate reductase Fe-S protein subunit-like protein n=1 Tax=Vecturithrix granuli TaxID=1499967 RepID=A0A081BZT0_VECG1|nr:succinate dehydrogenase/fumarate reductase Fe-S protein subunit-like protein [Candidatus Vecturithrix granuli]